MVRVGTGKRNCRALATRSAIPRDIHGKCRQTYRWSEAGLSKLVFDGMVHRFRVCVFSGTRLLGGSTGAALVSGLFCSLTLFGFSSKLKLPQMLKTAHEVALKNSKVE